MAISLMFWVYYSRLVVIDFHRNWSRIGFTLGFQRELLADLTTTTRYRFSAFWLRSKCSICSYQLNI